MMFLDILCFVGILTVLGLSFTVEKTSRQQSIDKREGISNPFQNH